MLSIQNLSFSYGSREVLSGINLRASAGEFVGILGANGCGKSTLFKCILRILEPSSGEIFIAGQNAKSLSATQLASKISYVPQKSSLMMGLSVKDFILLGLFCRRSSIYGYSREEYLRAQAMCERFCLLPEQDVRSLSGGEFGRALMARALISEPKIILLDEPTSAMDLHYAAQMMKECAALAASGISVLAIIHDLNLAAAYCSRFAFMKAGAIAHDGDKQLFCPVVLEEIFSLQAQVINHQNRPLVIY